MKTNTNITLVANIGDRIVVEHYSAYGQESEISVLRNGEHLVGGHSFDDAMKNVKYYFEEYLKWIEEDERRVKT